MSNYELSKLTRELYWRCCDMGDKSDGIFDNLIACLRYAKANGVDALMSETDDCKIWECGYSFNNESRCDFRIKMKDNKVSGYPPYDILLHTTEALTDKQVIRMIRITAVKFKETKEDYSPLDIMDDICDSHKNWWWEDGDREDIYISKW